MEEDHARVWRQGRCVLSAAQGLDLSTADSRFPTMERAFLAKLRRFGFDAFLDALKMCLGDIRKVRRAVMQALSVEEEAARLTV